MGPSLAMKEKQFGKGTFLILQVTVMGDDDWQCLAPHAHQLQTPKDVYSCLIVMHECHLTNHKRRTMHVNLLAAIRIKINGC